MWTLPEALLSPSERKIKVSTRGYDGLALEIDKKHFAEVVWNDPLISRQLIEHYGGNLLLSHLELVSIALKCLRSRERGEYLDGDLSYALMGLLRERPTIDRSESDFLAFARLSKANDSKLLLERLICMLPQNHRASWLSMDDAWDSNLWDIYPSCQVAGIGPGDTVILDGAFGASIRWKAFAPVAYVKKDSWKRFGARIVLHGTPLFFIIGLVMARFMCHITVLEHSSWCPRCSFFSPRLTSHASPTMANCGARRRGSRVSKGIWISPPSNSTSSVLTWAA